MRVKLTSIQACPIKHIWLIAHSVSVTRHSIIDASVFIAAINAWEILHTDRMRDSSKKNGHLHFWKACVLGSVEGMDMLGDKAHPFHMAWKLSDKKRLHLSRCIWQVEIIKGLGFNKGHMAQGGEPSLTMFQHYCRPLSRLAMPFWANELNPSKESVHKKNQYDWMRFKGHPVEQNRGVK